MKVNKLLKVASVAVLASTLAACGKEKVTKKDYEKWAKDNGYVLESGIDYEGWAEDNGYVQPTAAKALLEVSFNTFTDDTTTEEDEALENLTNITHDDILQKVESGYNFILMWGDATHKCTACAAYQEQAARWVARNHYEVYYTDSSYGTGNAKDEVMQYLGLNQDKYPRIYAIIGGEVQVPLSPSDSTDAYSKFDAYVKKYFEIEEFSATVKKLRNLAELRSAVANEEKFVLYVTRRTCPDCTKQSDLLRDDALRKYFKEFNGNLYEIVSEDVQSEYESIFVEITSEGKTNKYFPAVIDNAISTTVAEKDAGSAYWTGWSNAQFAEQIADMVASGVFDKTTLQLSANDFYKAAIEYGNNVVGYTEVNEGVLGGYYTSDTQATYKLIETRADLEATAGQTNVKYYITNDDGTMFLRSLRSTPTVVASGYDSIKNVTVSAERKTIYDVNTGKAIGYKKTVSATSNPSWNKDENKLANAYTGTNLIAFKYGQELAKTPAIGGRGGSGDINYANYIYWYNMNPDNITPRNTGSGNAIYETEDRIIAIQTRIIDWMNSWLIDWNADKAAA